MKLKDYFIAQKANTINDTDKFFLYEKIISQKNKKIFQNINIFELISIRSFAYGFVAILLLFSIYGVFIFDWDFSYPWFMVQKNINLVSADHIANIIDFNWSFYIKHDGKYYKTNKISNWDSVILKKWSEIVFDMDSNTKSKIIWPAKFSLQKTDNNYQLILSEWDFIQMESLEKSDSNVEIILDDITISSQNDINLLVTKQNNEYKINNQWGKIIVKKDKTTKELENQQLLAIKENDITLIQDIQDFGQAIAKQDISQTFAIVDTKNEKEEIAEKLIKEISTENYKNGEEDLQLARELWFIDGQAIPNAQQNKELSSILYNTSILFDLEWLYKNQLLGQQKEFRYYLNSLESKIQNLSKVFNIKLNSSENISITILEFKQELSKQYHIPSKYLDNLETITKWIAHIQTIENWSNTNIEEVDQLWENIKTNPPSHLVLK